jgi:chaperonin GroEL
VLRACRAPLTMIAENAGQDGGIVCEKVVEGKGNFGYNAADRRVRRPGQGRRDRPHQGHPHRPANAASVATLLLTSDALVAEKPKGPAA